MVSFQIHLWDFGRSNEYIYSSASHLVGQTQPDTSQSQHQQSNHRPSSRQLSWLASLSWQLHLRPLLQSLLTHRPTLIPEQPIANLAAPCNQLLISSPTLLPLLNLKPLEITPPASMLLRPAELLLLSSTSTSTLLQDQPPSLEATFLNRNSPSN